MPLVFGGAPLINVLVSMALHPPEEAPNPMLYLGFLITAGGRGDGPLLPAAGMTPAAGRSVSAGDRAP